jgi:hypothetical protein
MKKATATEALPMIGAPTTLFEADARAQPEPRRTTQAPRPAAATHAGRVALVVSLIVTCGWLLRDYNPLTPKHGPGYALGVCGGITLLLLTLYPARKHLRFMRTLGKLSHWFRIHMIFGVAAPLLVLFHCNFRPGAPNSKIALGSMLLVATSGVVGRYIYTRINHGLYGARATLEELHAELDLSAHTLGERLPPKALASLRLAAFTELVQARRPAMIGRIVRFVTLPLRARQVRRRVFVDLKADLDHGAAAAGWGDEVRGANEAALRETIDAYIAALVKEAQFRAYERLASLWHALHLPLFVMLLLTATLHVIAVQLY